MTLVAKTAPVEPDEAYVRRVCAEALRAEIQQGWQAVVIVKARGNAPLATRLVSGRLQVISDTRLPVPALWRTVRSPL